jgi:L-carnitine/gamma-butyrobetaine antiporter
MKAKKQKKGGIVMAETNANNSKKIDPKVFYPPLLLVVIFCAWCFLSKDQANAALNNAFNFFTGPLGWVFEWVMFAFLIAAIWLMFGKYGKKTFGNDKPQFSDLTWYGMLFTTIVGSSILYWGTIEPFYYLMTPPFNLQPFSKAAEQWALAYGMYHWGIMPNAMYAVVGVVFGYVFFIRKKELLRPSTACKGVLGKHADGWLGIVIDNFYIIGMITGVGTSLGLGTPLVCELISKIFGIQHTIWMDAVAILIWTVLITISVYFGLQKGISLASNIRMYLTFAVLLFIVVVGPTAAMFNNFTDGFGMMMQHFVRMSFYTDPYFKSGFPQGWTIFYWAWWIVYTIQEGIFLVTISKGRSVRQFVGGTIVAASVGAWVFFMVFGSYTLDIFNRNALALNDIINKISTERAIVDIWSMLPGGKFTLFILLVTVFISMTNVLNGIAFTLSQSTTKQLSIHDEPLKWTRVTWALIIGALTLGLLFLGGMEPVKTSSIVGAVGVTVIICLLTWSVFKDMNKYGWPDPGEELPEPEENDGAVVPK